MRFKSVFARIAYAVFVFAFVSVHLIGDVHAFTVSQARQLHNDVAFILAKELDRTDAPPVYRRVFNDWNKRHYEREKEIIKHPDSIVEIIDRSLKELPLSHFSFSRKQEDSPEQTTPNDIDHELSPQFFERKYKGTRYIYLRVPSFFNEFDPDVIYEAFKTATERNLPVVANLMGTDGGCEIYFLGFLLKRKTPTFYAVGTKPSKKEIRAKRIHMQTEGSAQTLALYKSKQSLETFQLRAKHILEGKTASADKLDSSIELILEQLNNVYTVFKRVSIHPTYRNKLSEIMKIRTLSAHKLLQRIRTGLLLKSKDSVRRGPKAPTSLSIQKELETFFAETEQELLKLKDEVSQLDVYLWTQDYWKGLYTEWKKEPNKDPIPFKGDIVFLVDRNTQCAAEVCAKVPMEYYELKQAGTLGKHRYSEQLYPRSVHVIGKTLGSVQVLNTETFEVEGEGHFTLSFPGGQVFTYISEENLEHVGVSGIPARAGAELRQAERLLRKLNRPSEETSSLTSEDAEFRSSETLSATSSND